MGDLLGVALNGAGERVRNTDTIRRVIAAFVERHAASSLGIPACHQLADAGTMEKVLRTVDEVAGWRPRWRRRTHERCPCSWAVGIASVVNKESRASHYCLYGVVDI
nr:unnamed protein product [Digitaria exilis]